MTSKDMFEKIHNSSVRLITVQIIIFGIRHSSEDIPRCLGWEGVCFLLFCFFFILFVFVYYLFLCFVFDYHTLSSLSPEVLLLKCCSSQKDWKMYPLYRKKKLLRQCQLNCMCSIWKGTSTVTLTMWYLLNHPQSA